MIPVDDSLIPPPASLITHDVAEATALAEGPEAVAQVIRLVGAAGTIPLKDLSRATRLPVPVLAAVRRELETRGVLGRRGGLVLTELGEELLVELGGSWVAAGCTSCGGAGTVVVERYVSVLERLRVLWERRPEVDVRLDQSFALPESNLRRVLYALDRGALLGRRALFLGDDDAGSIAAGLVAQELGSRAEVTALDVDGRVLGYLRGAAREAQVEVELVAHDARARLPDELRGRFDTVLTDPPYTLPGLELFLARALEATGPTPGAQLFVSLGTRPPEEAVRVAELFARMGLALRELRPGFNRYEGASVHAGTSDLYHLLVTADSRPTLGEETGPIYTGELRPHTRAYVCRQCGVRYEVGQGRRWETIEALKATGCSACGGGVFEQRRTSSRE